MSNIQKPASVSHVEILAQPMAETGVVSNCHPKQSGDHQMPGTVLTEPSAHNNINKMNKNFESPAVAGTENTNADSVQPVTNNESGATIPQKGKTCFDESKLYGQYSLVDLEKFKKEYINPDTNDYFVKYCKNKYRTDVDKAVEVAIELGVHGKMGASEEVLRYATWIGSGVAALMLSQFLRMEGKHVEADLALEASCQFGSEDGAERLALCLINGTGSFNVNVEAAKSIADECVDPRIKKSIYTALCKKGIVSESVLKSIPKCEIYIDTSRMTPKQIANLAFRQMLLGYFDIAISLLHVAGLRDYPVAYCCLDRLIESLSKDSECYDRIMARQEEIYQGLTKGIIEL